MLQESFTTAYFYCKDDEQKNNCISIFKGDRKSTRLNSSHSQISYAVFCLKKKKSDKSLPGKPTEHLGQTNAKDVVRARPDFVRESIERQELQQMVRHRTAVSATS